MQRMVIHHSLLEPVFIHGLSSVFHFVLLLVLYLHLVFKKSSSFYHKPTLFSFLVLSIFHLLICVSSYSYFTTHGWSHEMMVTQLDFLLTTLAWLGISSYLYYSNHLKFPKFLRSWLVFFFISCSFLNYQFLETHLLIKSATSIVMGVFFLYVGVFSKKEEKAHLQQPLLLRGDDGLRKRARRDELESPYSNAGIFSILAFSWMNPLLARGKKKTLDLKDVPQLDTWDSVTEIFPIFRSNLYSSSSSIDQVSTFKLVRALLFTIWWEVLLTGLCGFLYTCSTYVAPYLIGTFLQYLAVAGRRDFNREGYVLVSALFAAKLVETFSQRQWFFRFPLTSVRIRAALIAMIYKKGQTLSSQSKHGGDMINLMAVDAARVGNFGKCLHFFWNVPLQVVLALLILYKNLGMASISALVTIVLAMLVNFPLGKLQENLQGKLMKSKDERMKRTSETLRNMRILKLQVWEMKFLSKIVELRKNEEGWLRKYLYTSAMTSCIFWICPTFVSVVTLVGCVLMGIPLDAGRIFSTLATIKRLQEPISSLPNTISMIAQTKVSLDRIASFLRVNGLQPDIIEKLPEGSEISLEIKDGYFSWDLSSYSPVLKHINVQIFHGMRVAVCGQVGSGKSSLLSCILGEMPKVSGTVKLSGKKAYVAQSPWIQSGTIEENILFGKEMNREKYDRVLEACSLVKDLGILSFGDQTVIGERGINLSGGQKQRIQIGRALYQDADIYLFDDPFSAVDAHTGTHLFKECIQRFLGCKTVIFVTHQVEFLPFADLILVMKDGKITQSGKYEDILNSGHDFMELVGAHKKALSALNTAETGLNIEENNPKMQVKKVGHKEKKLGGEDKDEIVTPKQLVQEEEREKGRVSLRVYWKYMTTAYNGGLAPLIFLAQVLFQILQIVSNYWMTWATSTSMHVQPAVGRSTLIIVYVILAMGSSIFVFVRAVLLVTAGYRTATILSDKMHTSIFRAPMSFFDATPSGRILNRSSTDQSMVDMDIPNTIESFVFLIVQIVGVIALMSQVAWPIFIVFIPLIGTSIWYQQYYIPTARELTRLTGVCNAPLVQHFAESISGLTTIRSFDQEPKFMETNLKLIDSYSRPKFYSAGAAQWLGVRLDTLSCIIFSILMILLISVPEGTINSGIAGLAVTYGLDLSMLQGVLIYHLSDMENKIISVERLFQYASIPSEGSLVIEEHKPPKNWPSHGEVDIHDLQVHYAPRMPLVLRGITCTIRGGMKTGVVGRTGSGKSTLVQTLFRIVEPAAGKILIDGIDITTIGLHDLRSRLSIIPQDPTMFEGTVRSNLDPLEEHTDERIWEALDKCQLADEVRKKEEGLHSLVTENGENWSMGQRQLVCLGRVLLKKSKVLVLDEATASVDTATDNLIQQTLRQHFLDSTVIIIAHRITSVLDSNMVLLLDHGVILESDSPSKLLENKSSLFSKLVSEYTVRSTSSMDNDIDP